MFAASSDAFLGVEGASKSGAVGVGIDGSEEDGFVLRRMKGGPTGMVGGHT